MSQAPIMPLAVDAFIADTTHLDATETGAYLLIIMATWRNNGAPLADDDKRLARICKMSPARWRRIRPVLEPFFDLRDSVWCPVRDVLATPRRRSLPVWLVAFVFDRDGQSCAYCLDQDGPFEIDHIIPVSRGGTDDSENLTVACSVCNRSKGARTPREWLQ